MNRPPESPWVTKGVTAVSCTALAVSAGMVLNTLEQPQPPKPPAMAEHAVPVRVAQTFGRLPVARIAVYPVTVDNPGFKPVQASPDVLAQTARDGWRLLQTPNSDFGAPGASVTVEPVSTVNLPGITSVPDLCNKKVKNAFREKLLQAVVPGYAATSENETAFVGPVRPETPDDVIPVVVIEETKPNACVAGDAAQFSPIVIYGTTEASVWGHEMGHVKGMGHDTKVDCVADTTYGTEMYVLSKGCVLQEYGNTDTLMGGNRAFRDVDPLTGAALLNMDMLTSDQVQTLSANAADAEGRTQATVRLRSLTSADERAVKLLRIPIVMDDQVPTEDLEKWETGIGCADALYFEYSGLNEAVPGRVNTLKAMLVDETKGYLPKTYELPLNKGTGEETWYKLGNTSLAIRLDVTEPDYVDMAIGFRAKPAQRLADCMPRHGGPASHR